MTLEPPEFLAGGGEMGAAIRAFNWADDPLGPPEGWPQTLRTCLRIMLASRQPMWVWWGPELINFYNDAYLPIIGGKHPGALGQPAREVWHEIWDQIQGRIAGAMAGEATYSEAEMLIMHRNGYPEETYYTFSFSPVPEEDGTVGGIVCANTDDTDRVIGARRLALLRELASRTWDADTVDDVYALSAKALATDPRDMPFALIYRLEDDGARSHPARHDRHRSRPCRRARTDRARRLRALADQRGDPRRHAARWSAGWRKNSPACPRALDRSAAGGAAAAAVHQRRGRAARRADPGRQSLSPARR